jgi:hypothetical protein
MDLTTLSNQLSENSLLDEVEFYEKVSKVDR